MRVRRTSPTSTLGRGPVTPPDREREESSTLVNSETFQDGHTVLRCNRTLGKHLRLGQSEGVYTWECRWGGVRLQCLR